MKKPWIVGFSLSHNGGVCIFHGDKLVAAIQEERLSRIKRHELKSTVDCRALSYCLSVAGIDISQVDLCVVATIGAPLSKDRRSQMGLIDSLPTEIITIPHYLAHAYSAYATSGFHEATVLVVDGLGEDIESLKRDYPDELKNVIFADFPTAPPGAKAGRKAQGEIVGIYHASGTNVTLLEKHIGTFLIRGQHMPGFGSFGGMFSAAAELIFHNKFEAGKVMGLAPHGQISDHPDDFFTLAADGKISFSGLISKRYSGYQQPWPSNQAVFQNLAASTQKALEAGLTEIWQRCRNLGDSTNLAYAGGVALNSVANEKLIQRRFFDRHHIIPAAEDSGMAIGAAYHGLWQLTGKNGYHKLKRDSLGKTYPPKEIDLAIDETPYIRPVFQDKPNLIDPMVEALLAGKFIGLFEGGSEFGPRALGQRSIICDPRQADAKANLNQLVKHRESFRPFAPAVLEAEVVNWFNVRPEDSKSPFMLRVFDFQDGMKERVPAVVHIDGTGRVQTLAPEQNTLLYRCVQGFFQRTGVPMLLNTSFNIAGEPIVESPRDALLCALFSGLDIVVFEHVIVEKTAEFKGILHCIPLPGGDLDRSEKPVNMPNDAQEVLLKCNGERSGMEIRNLLDANLWSDLRILRALAYLIRTEWVRF